MPTCYSPVRHSSPTEAGSAFDLHVLSTPPAFVLSQDQTLRRCLNQAENRELDALDINQPKETHKGVHYMALTFGTLLSSQGADALVVQPFRPSFEAVSPMYTALRSGQTSGACPAVDQAGGPVRSRSVQRERYTTLEAPCTGVRGGAVLLSSALSPGPAMSLGAAGKPLVRGRVVERRPHRLPSRRSRPASHGGRGSRRSGITEVADEALPSSRWRGGAGHPRRLSRRIRAPRRGAGGGWPAAGAATSRRGRTTRPPRRHFRLQPRSPSQRRTGVTRRRGDGTARSPGGPRAWSSSGRSAPRCAGRSPP